MTGVGENGEQPILNVEGDLVALGPLRQDLLPLYTRWINDLGAARTPVGPVVPLNVDLSLLVLLERVGRIGVPQDVQRLRRDVRVPSVASHRGCRHRQHHARFRQQ